MNTSAMTKTRNKRSSMLWLYFTNIDNVKAKCGFCKSILSFKGGASANLKKHLISRHSDMLWKDPDVKFKQNYKIKYDIDAIEDNESQIYNNYYKNLNDVEHSFNDNNEINNYENIEQKPLEICSVSSYSIDEKIIELVKGKRELWDTTNPSYNKPFIRQELWNEVAKDADVNPKYAQRRWETLKSSYISDKNFQDPFNYTEQLSFLEDSLNAKNLPPSHSFYSGSSLETDVDTKNFTEQKISNSYDAVANNPTKTATTSAHCIGQLVTIKLEELPCDDARDEAELKIMNLLYEIKNKYSNKLKNSN